MRRRLVVMLVHFLDVDGLDGIGPDGVDRAVRVAQPDGAIALPLSLERVVSEPGDGAGGIQPLGLNRSVHSANLRTM